MLSDSNIYHVMARGNEKRPIFLNNRDREKFLSIIFKYVNEKDFSILAFCLMDNHYHLLIRVGSIGISIIMKLINTSYAIYFNKKYGRIGHLFHDRFRSEAINCDAHLLAAIRYIHQNPVKAGLAVKPELYPWSSCRDYLGNTEVTETVDCTFLPDMFHSSVEAARDAFIAFSNHEADYLYADSFNDKDGSSEEQKAISLMNQFLHNKGLNRDSLKHRENISIRSELINLIQNETTLSIRKIAKIMSLDKNMIIRTK
jgi:putative transposase